MRDLIEQTLVEYLELGHSYPRFVFLGLDECQKLDREFGGIMLDVFNCHVVLVNEFNHISFGDVYEE